MQVRICTHYGKTVVKHFARNDIIVGAGKCRCHAQVLFQVGAIARKDVILREIGQPFDNIRVICPIEMRRIQCLDQMLDLGLGRTLCLILGILNQKLKQ